MGQEFKTFVGIDISEDWLEVCVLPQATRRRFAQEAQGWQALADPPGAHRDRPDAPDGRRQRARRGGACHAARLRIEVPARRERSGGRRRASKATGRC